ncbi:MAG: transposase [Clostridiales bacterium]|nr:transposase [Clostridiales bacterium]
MQLFIDERFAEKIIPADDSVRLLDQMIEEMNLTPLMRAYSELGRKPATAPSTMLKIYVYANMENIYSSRDIASACRRDINFIWLLNGAAAPNHHEFARFRTQRLSQCAEELFFQIVEELKEIGEIKFEHLFVNGTKIEANANKYNFV